MSGTSADATGLEPANPSVDNSQASPESLPDYSRFAASNNSRPYYIST